MKRIRMGNSTRNFNGPGLIEVYINSIHVALDGIQLPGDIKLQRTARYTGQLCVLEEKEQV